ncbi:DUF4304 domain-containing protein [Treponema vincentii]|uniref:DUF4304 domain-containing protein n=1 Tax=Treponema vincentii TaxID=69710 RepID=UPI001BB09954|nr:DUF4304 domain-containing protein [Treponema vincentii]
MKPRELCEKAWQEIARNFPDFKVLGKGKTLRKIANNKDIIFEIYFQANRYNCESNVEFIPHINIYSKAMKKAGITSEGIIYGGELSSLAGREAGAWWQLAGASYRDTVTQITGLLHKHIMPLFADFEDTNKNIERILNGSLKGYALPYYIYYFGGKEPAERYFNKVIKEDKLKKKYISFYSSLKEIPKENIDLHFEDFYGASLIKFAYLHGLEIIQ